MGSSSTRLMRFCALVILLGALFLCSCRALLPVPTPTDGLTALRSALANPFGTVDPERFAAAENAAPMIQNRMVPVTAVTGERALTLEACRSIALANNLDAQAARIDELTKRAIEYSNKTKMLPHFIFTGDLSERDNLGFSYSDVLGREGGAPNPLVPGTGVTSYSTGHERSTWRYLLETRWSPTDAALAYYLSKSSINDRLKAHYHKVRVGQKLIATVDAAYFRLLSLQRCSPLANRLVAARTQIASNMKTAFKRKLVGVEDYNRAHQNLVRAQRFQAKVRVDTEKQRNILASAMGISPDYCDGGFYLVGALAVPCYNVPLCDMEIVAVQNRPEAVEAGLDYLNSENDLKRTIVKYLPRVSGFWRFTRDKDKFLYNKDWKEVGVAIYFDLLDWLGNLSESSAARFNSAKTHREMGAVALGITSQVRLAALQYVDALDELRATETALTGTQEVLQVAKERAAKDDLERLALEEAHANNTQTLLERMRALGEANATLAELQGTMGTNHKEPRPAG